MVTLSSPASATIPITDALSQYEEAWHATWPLAELEPRSWTTSWHYLLSASKMSTIPQNNKKKLLDGITPLGNAYPVHRDRA